MTIDVPSRAEDERTAEPLRIDLGCGAAKREGFVGLDQFPGDQVDHVLDLTRDRYPFDDDTVDEVFSAHFLEHIDEPNHVFEEIGRICKDGAKITFFTPFAWTDEAWLYGHLHGITEETWSQFGLSHRDVFAGMLGGRWQLETFVYVVDQAVIDELTENDVNLDFAIRYFKGVVREIGIEMEFRRDLAVPPSVPERVYVTSRFGPRQPLLARRRTSTTERVRTYARDQWRRIRR